MYLFIYFAAGSKQFVIVVSAACRWQGKCCSCGTRKLQAARPVQRLALPCLTTPRLAVVALIAVARKRQKYAHSFWWSKQQNKWQMPEVDCGAISKRNASEICFCSGDVQWSSWSIALIQMKHAFVCLSVALWGECWVCWVRIVRSCFILFS